jgi:hypothetical protein
VDLSLLVVVVLLDVPSLVLGIVVVLSLLILVHRVETLSFVGVSHSFVVQFLPNVPVLAVQSLYFINQ